MEGSKEFRYYWDRRRVSGIYFTESGSETILGCETFVDIIKGRF